MTGTIHNSAFNITSNTITWKELDDLLERPGATTVLWLVSYLQLYIQDPESWAKFCFRRADGEFNASSLLEPLQRYFHSIYADKQPSVGYIRCHYKNLTNIFPQEQAMVF